MSENKQLSPAEFLLLNTIRIETTTSTGISTGTGFFFSFKNNEQTGEHIPVIVTNKHVVAGAITGTLRFSLKDSNGQRIIGKHYDLHVNNFESFWIKHPEEDIDLCILPIAQIHREIQKSQQDLYYTSFTKSNIPSKEQLLSDYSYIEEITVVGYPDGIWDSVNNLPVTRKGITATPLQFDFENTPRYLIDSAIFGGSSGSPVFVFNQGTYSTAKAINVGTRLSLVGIVYAVAQHTVHGELKILDIPASKATVAQTLIPNNLGVTIHARKLLDFEKLLQ